MKATMSKDGIRRVDLSVPARLSAQDLAVMIVAASYCEIGADDDADEWADMTMNKSIRKLVAIAKDEILHSGTEIPHYRVGDNGLSKYADALASRIEAKMFA